MTKHCVRVQLSDYTNLHARRGSRRQACLCAGPSSSLSWQRLWRQPGRKLNRAHQELCLCTVSSVSSEVLGEYMGDVWNVRDVSTLENLSGP